MMYLIDDTYTITDVICSNQIVKFCGHPILVGHFKSLSNRNSVRIDYFTSCMSFFTHGEIEIINTPAIRAYIASCL